MLIDQPIGRLTVTNASPGAQSPLSDILSNFARLHPGIHLTFYISDNNVSLEGSTFDVAIRSRIEGHEGRRYKAIKLDQIAFGAFASAKSFGG